MIFTNSYNSISPRRAFLSLCFTPVPIRSSEPTCRHSTAVQRNARENIDRKPGRFFLSANPRTGTRCRVADHAVLLRIEATTAFRLGGLFRAVSRAFLLRRQLLGRRWNGLPSIDEWVPLCTSEGQSSTPGASICPRNRIETAPTSRLRYVNNSNRRDGIEEQRVNAQLYFVDDEVGFYASAEWDRRADKRTL